MRHLLSAKTWFFYALSYACLSTPAGLATAASCLDAGGGPKIGLVLSGGGARGTAHVGVLEVLERLKVPVHCIAGTSLGSVVGALYAQGLNAEEIKGIVETVDWNRGFTDEFPRELLPLRRKEEFDEFLIKFELGVRDQTINLPRGVIQGHGLHLLLKELMAGASLVNDFDKLPIPFRAVSTDIVNAEAVSLGSGDLALAVQASMAIPGVFSPIEIDNRLLVDGGVTDNLPVSVVREMGADVIIAVDISTPLTERKNLQSVVSILDQLTNVLTQKNVANQVGALKLSDIYINPDLGKFTTMDFASAVDIVKVGKVAAELDRDRLSELGLSATEYKNYRQSLSSLPELPSTVAQVVLKQTSKLSDAVLRDRINIGDEEEDFNLADFHKSLNAIYSTGIFERVGYRYVDQPDSTQVEVTAEDKTWGPDLIRFGFSLEDDFGGNNNFGISAGYSRKAINPAGGDFRAVGEIGETPRVVLEYFQPLSTLSEYYGMVSLEHQQYSQGQFNGSVQTSVFRTRRTEFGLYSGRQFSYHSDVRAGIRFARGQVQRRVGDISLKETKDFDEASLSLTLRHDTLDSIRFPKSGNRFRLEFESSLETLGADDEYDAVNLDGITALDSSLARWVASVSFKTATRNNLPPQKLFSQGGLLDTSGLSQNVRVGQHAGRFTLVAYRPLQSEQIEALNFPLFYGTSLNLGGVFQGRDEITLDNLKWSGSVFVAADTPAGPAFLGVGMAEGQGFSALLSLGVSF